ncbi:uncharacterized protein LOC144134809 [Amblyomma americanum]
MTLQVTWPICCACSLLAPFLAFNDFKTLAIVNILMALTGLHSEMTAKATKFATMKPMNETVPEVPPGPDPKPGGEVHEEGFMPPKWTDMDKTNPKYLMLAQEAMDATSLPGSYYRYVLDVRSVIAMLFRKREMCNITYTTVSAICTGPRPYKRENCKPSEVLGSELCSTAASMVAVEEFYQIIQTQCHEIEPHDSQFPR